ncbi:MAG: GGDEF domain-containing protein [Patescibacteria group bacterium]
MPKKKKLDKSGEEEFSFDPKHGLAEDLEKFPEESRPKIRALLAAYATPSPEFEELTAESLRHASIDPLTGLANRRSLDADFDKEIERAKRSHTALSAIFIDLDHFKSVNDEYGHDAGDAVLRFVARKLRTSVRATDVVARWGGEEFVILLSETNLDEAKQVAEKIRANIEEDRSSFDEKEIRITGSFGVAELNLKDGETKEGFIKRADACSYYAKQTGRNRVCALSPEKTKKHRFKKFIRKIRLSARRLF